MAALTSSTPTSFQQIPPVLRFREDDITVQLEPPLEGFPVEAVKGSLYITDSVLAFVAASGAGFQVDYPTLTLHAISRAESGPLIYCQLDDNANAEEGADEEADGTRELKITPTNAASLEPIFEALSFCAALHPDKSTGDSDGFADDAFIDADEAGFETFTGGEGEELSEVGRAALEHLESIIYDPHAPKETNGEPHGDPSPESPDSSKEDVAPQRIP